MAKTQHKKEVSNNRISKTTIILYLVVIIAAVVVLSIMGAGQSTGGSSGCCDCSECKCFCCGDCEKNCGQACQCVSSNYAHLDVYNAYTRTMQNGAKYWCDFGTIPAEPAEPACDPDTSAPEDCPLQLGVCKGAQQNCILKSANTASGYWPGCKPKDYVAAAVANGGVYSTEEICDGKDNNCDGEIDEGCDVDQDGYCNKRMSCSGPKYDCRSGECTDCDDSNALRYPTAEEICDGIDNNCNNKVDEGCECSPIGTERACPLTQGVCGGKKQICKSCTEVDCEQEGQLSGWTKCDYGTNYKDGSETGGRLSPVPCTDGVDNDCDGLIDCADPDCRRFCPTTAS